MRLAIRLSTLTEDGVTYKDAMQSFKRFDEKPFWVVARTAIVWFSPTDDPYWLDVRDRRRQLFEGREPSPLRI